MQTVLSAFMLSALASCTAGSTSEPTAPATEVPEELMVAVSPAMEVEDEPTDSPEEQES
jgi:hypothetical protein